MIATKASMDAYQSGTFYLTIAHFGKDDVHLAKHQKVDRAAAAPVEVIRKKEHY